MNSGVDAIDLALFSICSVSGMSSSAARQADGGSSTGESKSG
jgi:hypothetical protein